MANHFQMIGLAVDDEKALEEWALRAAEAGTPVPTPGGEHYLRWEVGEGAEVWVAIDEGHQIVGVHPHFHGAATMRVALIGRVLADAEDPLLGAFHGWANPVENGAGENDETAGDYPFVFAAPDFAAWAALPLPVTVSVSVAAFAHELSAYPDEDAYMASQESELKFAAESFIPSGLFTDGEDEAPRPLAMFTGRVLETDTRTPPGSWRAFTWARVRTLGGEVDVVAARDEVQGEVVPGGIVTGSFWLSGRIAGAPPAPSSSSPDSAAIEAVRPWWRRLLGG